MVKKFVVTIILSLSVILLTGLFIYGLTQNSEAVSLYKKTDVDMSETFKLYVDSPCRTIEWDKDYIEIKGTHLYTFLKETKGSDCKIDDIGNELKITSIEDISIEDLNAKKYILSWWLPLREVDEYFDEISRIKNESSYQYIIYLPRDLNIEEWIG